MALDPQVVGLRSSESYEGLISSHVYVDEFSLIDAQQCDVALLPQGELPGRLWDGKEAVAAAVASVAEACPEALGPAGAASAVAALVEAAGGHAPLWDLCIPDLVEATAFRILAYIRREKFTPG